MSEFKNYHPLVAAAYFIPVIGFSMLLMHPVCLAVSLLSALCFSIMCGGRRSARFALCGALPTAMLFAVANPLFSHAGVTVLAFFPNGNPLTLESILFGLAQGTMLCAVMLHFSAFNSVMTSDKLMYLTGRLLPSLSLVVSMTLRFVPHFAQNAKKIAASQKVLGLYGGQGMIKRAGGAVRVFSVLVTRSLEESVDTADSMKSRGFGSGRRTAFSNYRLARRDTAVLVYTLVCTAYLLWAYFDGHLKFAYYPVTAGANGTAFAAAAAVWTLLCTCPIIIELLELYKWKKSELKI